MLHDMTSSASSRSKTVRLAVTNFLKFNPPHKAVNKEVREGAPLKWFRLDANWYEDEAVMSLPTAERYLWPFLLARAARGQPVGTIAEGVEHLARLANISSSHLRHALDVLSERGLIKGWRRSPLPVSAARGSSEEASGDPPPGHHPEGGYRRTHVPTDGPHKVRGVRAALRAKYGMDAKLIVDEYVRVRTAAGLAVEDRARGQLATQAMRCRDQGWSLELCLEAVTTYATSKRAALFFGEWVASVFNRQCTAEDERRRADDPPMTRDEFAELLEKAHAVASAAQAETPTGTLLTGRSGAANTTDAKPRSTSEVEGLA